MIGRALKRLPEALWETVATAKDLLRVPSVAQVLEALKMEVFSFRLLAKDFKQSEVRKSLKQTANNIKRRDSIPLDEAESVAWETRKFLILKMVKFKPEHHNGTS